MSHHLSERFTIFTRFISFNDMMYKYWVFPLTLLLICVSCQSNHVNDQIEILPEYADLKELMNQSDDQIIVLNFWSTTCQPCIKEMPHFNKLSEDFKGEEVKILLVSLNKPSDLENKVIPFVKKLELKPETVLLADENYSAWTEKIDESWYGALPATLIFNKEKSNFRFGAYESYEELVVDLQKVN